MRYTIVCFREPLSGLFRIVWGEVSCNMDFVNMDSGLESQLCRSGCATLDKLLNLSVLSFLHLSENEVRMCKRVWFCKLIVYDVLSKVSIL